MSSHTELQFMANGFGECEVCSRVVTPVEPNDRSDRATQNRSPADPTLARPKVGTHHFQPLTMGPIWGKNTTLKTFLHKLQLPTWQPDLRQIAPLTNFPR